MLKHIQQIEFRMKKSNAPLQSGSRPHLVEAPEWKVSSRTVKLDIVNTDFQLFQQVQASMCDIILENPRSDPLKDQWMVVKAWLAKDAISSLPLRDFATQEHLIADGEVEKRHIPDAAIAAQIQPLGPKGEATFYNSLPLENKTGFPISLHSRFAITPDRRDLRSDGKGGEWNKFLADSCFPALYFLFLEHLLYVTKDPLCQDSYWPPASKPEHYISQCLHIAFWTQLPSCTRNLFGSIFRTPIARTIFDVRLLPNPLNDPVLALVKRFRPSYGIVNSPRILTGLQDLQTTNPDQYYTVNILNSKYVRGLLQDGSAKMIMASPPINDHDLRGILWFAKGHLQLHVLNGCWVLRLNNGEMGKVQILDEGHINGTTIHYIVDNEGCKLFESVSPGSFVMPGFLNPKIVKHWTIVHNLNVQRLDAAAVDRFVKKKLKSEAIRTFNPEESDWISRVSRYVSSKDYQVDFYRCCPTLPLSQPHTFVSMDAWDNLPILPPTTDIRLREIVNKLPGLYILSNLNFKPLLDKSQETSFANRFAECLYRLVSGQCYQLEELFVQKLTNSDLLVREA